MDDIYNKIKDLRHQQSILISSYQSYPTSDLKTKILSLEMECQRNSDNMERWKPLHAFGMCQSSIHSGSVRTPLVVHCVICNIDLCETCWDHHNNQLHSCPSSICNKPAERLHYCIMCPKFVCPHCLDRHYELVHI